MTNQRVTNFLKKVGLSKTDDLTKGLSKVFSSSVANDYIAELDRLQDIRDENKIDSSTTENISRQLPLVEFSHQNKKLSSALASYYDYDVYEKFMDYLFTNKSLVGKTVLDFGCGSGLISCFIASILPNVNVVGVDESPAAIRIANLYKQQLKLKNVDFYTSDSSDYDKQKYTTLISVRTFHENIGMLKNNYNYLPFSQMINTIADLYKPYITFLQEKLLASGQMICMERAENRGNLIPILCALNDSGFEINLELTNNISCTEGDEERGLAFIACRNTGTVPSTLLNEILECSIEEAPYGYSGIYAQYRLEEDHGNLIDAFVTVEKNKIICGLQAVYYNKKNNSQFILYQQTKLTSQIQYFDIKEDWEEMQQLMKSSRATNSSNGFSIVDFDQHTALETCIKELSQ